MDTEQYTIDSEGDLFLLFQAAKHLTLGEEGLKNVQEEEVPNPNIVAALDDEPPPESTLKNIVVRVSSKHVRLASPFFSTLLNGSFKEGRSLRRDGKAEVSLLEDDAAAFLIILNVIHGRLKRVPRHVSLQMLTQIAIIADKYALEEALQFVSASWINDSGLAESTFFPEDSKAAVCISWVFKNEEAFKRATYNSMCLLEHPFEESDPRLLPIPNSVQDAIDESREETIGNLIEKIYYYIELYSGTGMQCKGVRTQALSCDSLVLGTLIKGVSSFGLVPRPDPPFAGLSYQVLLRNLSQITYLKHDSPSHPRCGVQRRMKRFLNLSTRLDRGYELHEFANGNGGSDPMDSD
ncbi:MAG: hypothetical protein M4579_001012 [Chaenotheca gracillima]|nr:MAG: hypothetical protein M4579_001012 [Chaenotheca gracillima]